MSKVKLVFAGSILGLTVISGLIGWHYQSKDIGGMVFVIGAIVIYLWLQWEITKRQRQIHALTKRELHD